MLPLSFETKDIEWTREEIRAVLDLIKKQEPTLLRVSMPDAWLFKKSLYKGQTYYIARRMTSFSCDAVTTTFDNFIAEMESYYDRYYGRGYENYLKNSSY
jgi:hypothetical protein